MVEESVGESGDADRVSGGDGAMKIETKPLMEINQQAFRVLYCELGVVDAVRFLRQFTVGFGDYTKDRETFFGGKGLREIVGEMKEEGKAETNSGERRDDRA